MQWHTSACEGAGCVRGPTMRRVRILVLQITPATRRRPVPRFDAGLGTLIALLLERKHEVSLVGLSRFDLPRVKDALARSLPQLVYADISAVCTDAARRTFEHIQRYEFLPIVAGGAYAAVDPAACMSMPGVHAAAVGEPDASLVTYLERIRDPAIGQVVRGVWLRDERGLARPKPPPLVEDLDSLPPPHRALFRDDDAIARCGEVAIAIGRGCPQRCAYCPNRLLSSLHDGGEWTRRRTAEHVVDEIVALRERHGDALRRVRVVDHAFALDPAWLAAFLDEFARRAHGLALRCHLRLNAITPQTASALAVHGRTLADVELISGSDFIRNEVFEMDVSAAQIDAGVALLREHRIASRAIVYLGAPYESEASLDETRALLRRVRPDFVDARPYFPFPGTRAADLAREYGWLHPRGEEQYHTDRCGVDMPACRPAVVEAAIRALRREFPAGNGAPAWRRWLGALLRR